MSNTKYYQRSRNVILNKAKDYYENNKERLREHTKDKYRNLSEEEKKQKREHGKDRHHNMFKEKKTRTKKMYREDKKSQRNSFLIMI